MSKYHSRKVTWDGIEFDSLKEARRYRELWLLKKAGEITNLQRQVRFVLIPSQRIDGKVVERSVSYIADFVYEDHGEIVVEDVKGLRTREYILKRKLMLWLKGIRIKET